MPLSFDMDEQLAKRLANEIDTNGFAKLSGAVTEVDLRQLRAWTDEQAARHQGEYFAYHGEAALGESLLASYWTDPQFKSLLAGLYRHAAQRDARSDRIFPVLRCVQGNQGKRESNAFHYDASLVTALVPVFIPTEGEERGDLMLFPNIRRVRSWVLFNVIEKALLQNKVTRGWILKGMQRKWLNPYVLRLEPGNVYFFWGYRTLHANQPCGADVKRATALFHFGDPHTGSLATRLILRINQGRARRMSNKAGNPPPASTPS
ncbi:MULTISPECIES: hypothetical protein [unclassified Pseudomonas]|uniref:hypothetical protein n=1 Tax=unclassified Pseudomonas TaxID=196821 RepID=UPI0025FB0B5E|nr:MULTISPECIES: hypothetical protein [unclassified Pseudomonas]